MEVIRVRRSRKVVEFLCPKCLTELIKEDVKGKNVSATGQCVLFEFKCLNCGYVH